ncbi:hypothetical protein D9M68_834300 [compost metagenome]
MLQEGRNRLRGRQEPDLVRQDDEVEVFIARERERRQRARLHVGRLGERVEKSQERPGPGKALQRPQRFHVQFDARVGAQRRGDLPGHAVELPGLRVLDQQDAFGTRARGGRRAGGGAGRTWIHWRGVAGAVECKRSFSKVHLPLVMASHESDERNGQNAKKGRTSRHGPCLHLW